MHAESRPFLPQLRTARALLVLGLPLVGSHLAQFGLQITDTIMLGWYGVEAIAAGGLAATVFFSLFFLGSGFAQAVMPMVASAAAAGDEAEVRRATRMGMWLSLGFALAILPLLWVSGPILAALGQPLEVAAGAQDYLRVAGLGMGPALVVMVLKSYLAALGRTQVILWVTLAGVGVNIALNWAFIFGNWGAPELGVRGAALASVLVQVATLAALAAYAGWLPELRRFALFRRLWRPDPRAMGRVFRLGWPIGLAQLAESALFSAAALMIGRFGAEALAAHVIALEIAAMFFMVHLGLSHAATVMVGQARGRADLAGLRRAAGVAVAVSLLLAAVFMVLLLVSPEPMVRVFLDRDDPRFDAILAAGVSLLAMAALFQFADAGQVMAMGLLRGVQDTRGPMWIAAFSYWGVGAPAGWVIGDLWGFGAEGVWLGLVVGLTVAAVLLMLRFWRRVGQSPSPAAAAS